MIDKPVIIGPETKEGAIVNTGVTQAAHEARLPWPKRLIKSLSRLIRTHENALVRLVIATHIILVTLDLANRATFQGVVIEFKLIEVWTESPVWIVLSGIIIGWLTIFRNPPQVIWGLWASTGVLGLWGIINLMAGFSTDHPVSLLGPTLILFIAAPLSWTAADSMMERISVEIHNTGQQKGAITRGA